MHSISAGRAIPAAGPSADFSELPSYTGANATAVESSVTTILEEAINGVEGMRYMTSTSGNDGSSSINITFELTRPSTWLPSMCKTACKA